MSNFKTLYEKEIKNSLMKEYNYTTVMQVPKITKIVINMGVGEGANDSNSLMLQ